MQRKCKTFTCRRKPDKGRQYCSTCRVRKWRIKNPISYVYNALKNNAKRRGKYFDLTLQEFTEFVSRNNYLELRGISPSSMSVDRIDNTAGYTKSNIRAITFSENASKGSKNIFVPNIHRHVPL